MFAHARTNAFSVALHKSIGLVEPILGRRLPGDQLLLAKPQGNLLLGGSDGIRAVNDVASYLYAEITTNRSRQRVHGIGGAKHLATGFHHIQSLPDHGNDGTGAHVVHQTSKEGTRR